MRFAVLFAGLLVAHSAAAMDLKSYLDQVVRRHRGLESLRVSREASEDKRVAGDLALVPALTLNSVYLSDKKQPNSFGATESKTSAVGLGLAKKFSTGTSVGLTANSTAYENVGAAGAFAPYARFSQGNLGISISQSLWKDAFGHATRLRQAREEAVAALEGGNYDLQARQILADAEAAFWDQIYLQREMQIRKDSLERALKIESWIRRRVMDGISDRADLLSAQALVASRRLQLSIADDDLTANRKKVRDFMELSEGEASPELGADIGQLRPPKTLVESGGRVVRLDAWLSSLQANAQEKSAQETEDSLRADLTLSGAYKTNSYEPDGGLNEGTRNWNKNDTPTTQVALTWTYLFDADAKGSAVSAARKGAAAAKLTSERKQLESETAWSEMNRRHSELSKKIEAAETISQLQGERAKAQQNKLSRGRAITSDVITSEQDAAESELQLTKLKAEQRKLEAQSRLFIVVKE